MGVEVLWPLLPSAQSVCAWLLCVLCFHGWCVGLCCVPGASRGVARVYLGRRGLCWRAVWLHGVHHDLVIRRGGVGGERRGGRGARSMTLSL